MLLRKLINAMMIFNTKSVFFVSARTDSEKCQIILLYEVLALAIPNSIIWLTSFILLFHSWLNFLAEFLMFADREVSDYQTLAANNFPRILSGCMERSVLENVRIPCISSCEI